MEKPASPFLGVAQVAAAYHIERRPVPTSTAAPAPASHFVAVYRLSPQEKIVLIRQGRPAADLGALAAAMALPKETLIDALGCSRATINRKAREADLLSSEESERLLGLEALVGQVESMVAESGDPSGFDAAHWLGHWLGLALPSLGGRTPLSYLDTVEGQKLLAQLLAMVHSGAYA